MESDKSFVEEFIDIYKKHPALWKVKSPLSKNKILRDCGINELLTMCKERYPEADKEFVRKKINNLRTAFRRELVKVKKSKRTGCSPDDVYIPTLWYYDLLYFTADDESGRTGIDSLDDDEEATNTEVDESHILSPGGSTIQSDISVPTPSAKRAKTYTQKRNEFIERANETMKTLSSPSEEEDEFTIAGKRFAYQLRGMSEDQRLLAEKIIGEVMYYGRTGKLTEDSFPSQVSHGAPYINYSSNPSTQTGVVQERLFSPYPQQYHPTTYIIPQPQQSRNAESDMRPFQQRSNQDESNINLQSQTGNNTSCVREGNVLTEFISFTNKS